MLPITHPITTPAIAPDSRPDLVDEPASTKLADDDETNDPADGDDDDEGAAVELARALEEMTELDTRELV